VAADSGANVVGVGEEEAALDAQHDDAGHGLVLGMALDVEP